MDDHWSELTIYEGEDAEALKTRFVELTVQYPRHTPLQVTEYIFKDLREPTRYMQAAAIWSRDLSLLERARQLELKGPPVTEASENDLIRRSLAIADDRMTEAKDKIAAIRLAGELQGMVKKSVDAKVQTTGTGIPQIVIAQYAD